MYQSYAESGSHTTIHVNTYGSGGGGGQKNGKELQLTDDALSHFASLEHVTGTSPELSVNVEAKSGAYEANFNIVGVSQAFLQQLKLKEGSVPEPNQKELSIVYGNTVLGNSFYKNYDWDNPAKIDPDRDSIFFMFPEPAGEGSRNTGADSAVPSDPDSSGGQQKPRKKYMIKTAGIMEGGEQDYSEYSMYCYADIDTLKSFLRKIYKKALVPNPMTNKLGKPYPYYVYEEGYVYVDKMKNVEAVQKAIADEGYTCYSNLEGLQQVQKQTNVIQMVLGGIGAVSLLVAAIGIMNTMMMSIYERTKEIGVMKVLGCDMGDIRNMFLSESAMIGFLGGIFGLLLSLLISAIINFLVNRSGGSGMMGMFVSKGSLSVIPIWLGGVSIFFAVLVGTFSGYFPAVRAMKLSPLAAIRNE